MRMAILECKKKSNSMLRYNYVLTMLASWKIAYTYTYTALLSPVQCATLWDYLLLEMDF